MNSTFDATTPFGMTTLVDMNTAVTNDTNTTMSTTSAPSTGWQWQDICKVIVGIVGIIGNSLVIAVYTSKRKRKNTTNVLILALAIADLISSIFFIPLPVPAYVPQNAWGEIYCRVIHTKAIQWMSIEASVYTLTLLSIERYMAVVHPVRYRVIFRESRPRRFVWVIWLFALIVKSFNFYNTIIVDNVCIYIEFPKGFNVFLGIGVALVEYFIPIIVMIVTNTVTIRALRAQARNLQLHGSNHNAKERGPAQSVLRTRRKIIHVVLIVIISFIVCWTPNQISLLLINLDILSVQTYFFSDTHQAFIILAFTNSCANPIIYTFKNKNFRDSMVQLFVRKTNRVSDDGNDDTAGGSDPTAGVNTISKTTGTRAGTRQPPPALADDKSYNTEVVE
ncbi:allatostatin-A receptor-like [Asterias rubens]|uniref:allatostatin-A receptor-like n=1 Tax=Asterias rubens TaxID=7604 RepID=UPI00145561E0|nr:allatostatin-A receptor-like [Asterias rubens]XP_033639982.1 allatostatin-A receptor-like [Asterias rubens]